MHQPAWDQIEQFYPLAHLDQSVIKQFRQLKLSQTSHTKGEGNPAHYCVFFLPIVRSSGLIYLGHHKKAADWIPPGGHIEPGEIPTGTVQREMQEELGFTPTESMLTPYALSVKQIDRPGSGCLVHYDAWYLVELSTPLDFHFDSGEYHATGWFSLEEGIRQIKHNPDFAKIISHLL